VSAPVFKKIAEAALRYLGVPPTINPAPPVLVARNTVNAVHLTQPPDMADSLLKLASETPSGVTPNLVGLSARDALRTLTKLGLAARLAGDGVVVSQSPQPGTPVEPGGVCTVVLERTSVVRMAGGAQP